MTKTNHMWKNLLIFFFCILIYVFFIFGGALRKELLYERGGTTLYWSSRLEVFRRIGVLRSFTKFTGKHLSKSLIFNKGDSSIRLDLVGFSHVSVGKKWKFNNSDISAHIEKLTNTSLLWHICFPVNFPKFLRSPFLQNTVGGYFCL